MSEELYYLDLCKHYERFIQTIQCTQPQVCRFSNCKLAVQFKTGLQRLAQLGYSNVHWLCVNDKDMANIASERF